MKKIIPLFKELLIVTSGVLIALFLSDLKETKQSKSYYNDSIQAIEKELEANCLSLKSVTGKHAHIIDTLAFHYYDTKSLLEIFEEVEGIQFAALMHVSFDFYQLFYINLIDIEFMSALHRVKTLADLLKTKLEHFSEFSYDKFNTHNYENKVLAQLYLRDIVSTEKELLLAYESIKNHYINGLRHDD